ncbi:helix-turn-helix domain-containing protein [Methylopila sp. Yamaguchi]|uniref:helix-turn-helix domain-containing protein n=1 Tax=Methylopila sp. Yamaguchi TaxID=1437817 RepID=UPI001357D739
MSLRSQLSYNLARILREKNISQAALSRVADVDRGLIGKILTGSANPGLETVEKLAQALGVSANKLLSLPPIRRPGAARISRPKQFTRQK